MAVSLGEGTERNLMDITGTERIFRKTKPDKSLLLGRVQLKELLPGKPSALFLRQ